MVERETIITDSGTGGGGGGMGIVLVLLVILLLVAGGWLVFSRSGNTATATLNVPKVTVETPGS